jgi:hypothetical protein
MKKGAVLRAPFRGGDQPLRANPLRFTRTIHRN